MRLLADEFSLEAYLSATGRGVREIRHGVYQVDAGSDRSVRGRVVRQGEWIDLAFPWPHGAGGDPHGSLREYAAWSGLLPSSWKFSHRGTEPRFELRCEVRAGGSHELSASTDDEAHWGEEGAESGLGRRLGAALQALDDVLDGGADALRAVAATATSTATEPPQEGSSGASPDLARACAAAGWPSHERAGGRVAAPLDVPGMFCEAIVAPCGDGGFRAAYTLESGERSALSATASSLFLLRANRVYRMARTSTAYSPTESRRADSGEVAGALSGIRFVWDVVMPGPVEPDDLSAALSALSVACRGTVRELQVLADERVAGEYLAAQGTVF